MRTNFHVVRQERGVALVIAMLVLLVLSIFSAIMMMTVTTQSKITGNDSRRQRALSLSEAGISEALVQLNKGYVSLNTANPRNVSQIFNVAAGSVPVLGTDSSGTYTRQPAGALLNYTTTGSRDGALTVRFKTDASRTVIYRYDSTRNPAVNTLSGQPIMEIISTGRVGNTTRTIVADVVARPPTVNTKGAIVSGGQFENGIADYVCGFNHSATTPDWTSRYVGRNGANPGADPAHSSCIASETGSNNVAGIWGAGSVNTNGGVHTWGAPASLASQTGMYTGPWDVLGMTQSAFTAWLPPRRTTAPASWNGCFYLDKDATVGNGASSGWTFGNISGEGFLYIEGASVQVTGTFFWRGLVVIKGQFQHQGAIWILGGMVMSAQTQTQNQSGAILYSLDAINNAMTQYAGQYQRIAWHEID